MAGREIVVKYLLQAIHNYCMNIFLIPITLDDEIQWMMNSYWWGLSSRLIGNQKE